MGHDLEFNIHEITFSNFPRGRTRIKSRTFLSGEVEIFFFDPISTMMRLDVMTTDNWAKLKFFVRKSYWSDDETLMSHL